MSKAEDIMDSLQQLIGQGVLLPVRAGTESYVIFFSEQGQKALPLIGKACELELKLAFRNLLKIKVSRQDYLELQAELEMLAYEHPLEHDLANRVYNDKDGAVYYDLNQDSNEAVVLHDGTAEAITVDRCLFKRSVTYQAQVMPDLCAYPKEALGMVKKHFNLLGDRAILLTLYLVSSFSGLKINHPILVLTGEKGSSKSTTMRKLVRLIDPKNNDLCGLPRNMDNLEIRLANSYLVDLDNLSSIRQGTSDTLARAATGGSVAKRKLYSDSDEVILNIKSLVILNGVSMIVNASDLADRCLFLELKRIKPFAVKTETQIWEEFEKDLPRMLGACLNALALALNDREALQSRKRVRMADWHELCLRIGKVIGVTEDQVNKILFQNQQYANQQILDGDVTALCFIELMHDKTEYTNSVSGLLKELQKIAGENGISESALPKAPNKLTGRLNKVKSNLEQQEGITYTVVNVGTFREIRVKRKPKEPEVVDPRKISWVSVTKRLPVSNRNRDSNQNAE